MVYFPNTFSKGFITALESKDPEQAAGYIERSSDDRIAFEKWAAEAYDALVWSKDNPKVSFSLLHAITSHFNPEEYFRLNNIFKLFQTRLELTEEARQSIGNLKKESTKNFLQSLGNLKERDPDRFKKFLLAKDEKEWTLLHHAGKEGDFELFSYLSSKAPDVYLKLMKLRSEEDLNPLMIAWICGKMDIIRLAGETQKNFFEEFLHDRFGPSKLTPLIFAATEGQCSQFEYAARTHAEIFIRSIQKADQEKRTCLHWAIIRENKKIVELIRQNDPEIFLRLLAQRDCFSLTPMHYAIKQKDHDFLSLIRRRYPNKYQEFMSQKEPDVFCQIFNVENGAGGLLLHSLAAEGNQAILKLISEKEPEMFLLFMKKRDKQGWSPLQHAVINKQEGLFEWLAKESPAIFEQLADLKFIDWTLKSHSAFASRIARLFRDPILQTVISAACLIEQGDKEQIQQAIRSGIEKHSLQKFIAKWMQSSVASSYLEEQEDLLLPYFQTLSNLDFLPITHQLKLLLHLSPSQIKSLLSDLPPEKVNKYLNKLVSADGEELTVKEVLLYAHNQFGPYLSQPSAFESVYNYLQSIKPSYLAAASQDEEIRKVLVVFLPATPGPHFRVLIPALSCDEFLSFMQQLHLAEQLRYYSAATLKQKIVYIQDMPRLLTSQVFEWKAKLQGMCTAFEHSYKNEKLERDVLKAQYQQLKDEWVNNCHDLTRLSQTALVFSQISTRILQGESSTELLLEVLEKVDLELIEYRRFEKEIESLRIKIWIEFKKIPGLEASQIPQELICPITAEIMQDPVKDKYGHRYEKEAIISWIERDGRSPLTRQPLSVADLVPDEELKKRIYEFQKSLQSYSHC